MISELDNPFSVTKATEFSDEEINEYWVEFNTKDKSSIESILNPREFLPKYVIGGKGCGKTHLLRYFSFPLQKIRHNNNIEEVLGSDKYIGLYSVFHGLNSSRFESKGIDSSQWESIFEYYFELYMSDNLLNTIQRMFLTLKISSEIEKNIVRKVFSLLHSLSVVSTPKNISELIIYLGELRRKIDYQIQNAAFTRKLDFDYVKVLFSSGDLIFGIPKLIVDNVELFREVKFIYVFDEYEKLFEWQKEFVNTLVWDKRNPVTFWIGARRHGYTTRKTKSGQEMKAGSEFQPIDLDSLIRNDEDLYKKFAERLYVNRLSKFYNSHKLFVPQEEINQRFCKKFEKYSEDRIVSEVMARNKSGEYKHLKDLRKKLTASIKLNVSLELKTTSQVDEALELIKLDTNNNPLEQKFKLFLLYQSWYNAKTGDKFELILKNINSEFQKYKSGKDSQFDEIIDKRRKDFIAQLTKESKIKNTEYAGINKFIEISEGNARSFILILKKSIEYAKIRGERPLDEGGSISLDSQYFAVYDTAKWFYEDAELVGESGKHTYEALKRLTDYLIEERFCDKPVETTVSCFYVKEEDLSAESMGCIAIMQMHSILIENEEGRFEKNTGRKERLFQLNKTLSPLWNLPAVVRGSVYLKKEIAESIFNVQKKKNFDRLLKRRKSQLNAPDFIKDGFKNGTDTLFF